MQVVCASIVIEYVCCFGVAGKSALNGVKFLDAEVRQGDHGE